MEFFLEFFLEILLGILSDFNFVHVGVCGCADVGKEKFDLMTGGGGRDKIDH